MERRETSGRNRDRTRFNSPRSRRDVLGGIAGAIGMLVLASPRALPAPYRVRVGSVLETGADARGRSDSSAAFAKAIERFDEIRIPAGTYVVGDVRLRAAVTLQGDGERSTIVQRAGARFVFTCDSGSSNPRDNLEAIVIRDLQLRGRCDSEGFSEFVHLLSLNGVSHAQVSNVVFRGFQGDGLYLGSSNTAGQERHNLDVTIRNCLFDGINRKNRNGISVIDCDGLGIESCRFSNTTRADMPGAIDLEPGEESYHVVRNVRIVGNSFDGIGGGVGTVAMYISGRLAAMPSNIVIENNSLNGPGSVGLFLAQRFRPTEDSMPQGIAVRGNRLTGPYERCFDIRGIDGLDLDDNSFQEVKEASLVGYPDASAEVRQMALRRNSFRHCGSRGGVALSIFNASDLHFLGNQWIDCGNGSPASYDVDFNSGASRGVVFAGNHFASPAGRTRFAIQKELGHRFDVSSNRFDKDNRVDDNLRNAFQAANR